MNLSIDGDAQRIDVHHHVTVPFYHEWLASHGHGAQPWAAQAERREAASESLASMDTLGISQAILSVPGPGLHFGTASEAASMSRRLNDHVANIVGAHPERFGFFARLPIPYVDESVEELTYAFDVLGADGVVLSSNSGGMYPGHPQLRPVMEAMNERETVVFVHPCGLDGVSSPGFPPGTVDFLLDTTRAAIDLARSGTIAGSRGLRFILSHAGGMLPYAAVRIAHTTQPFMGHERTPEEYLSDFRTFYFDTAQASGPNVFPSLFAFADETRILYGSDIPYAPPGTAELFTSELDDFAGMQSETLQKINRENAAALFPGLAARERGVVGAKG